MPWAEFQEVAPKRPKHTAEPLPLMIDALEQADLAGFVRKACAENAPITVVVNDAHRFTDTRTFLDALFSVAAGDLSGSEISVLRLLVAAGSHQAEAPERRAHEDAILGPWKHHFHEIAWHDARDPRSHKQVGGTTLHHWMAEGGFYIACGSMEPHYFAGITGAHKTLTVGVMGIGSLTDNHMHAVSPEAQPLKLMGNPVHEGIIETLGHIEKSGARLLALNQIVVKGRVVACTAGDPRAALNEGLPVAGTCFSSLLLHQVDVVVAEVKPPLDRDLYQADKGIKNTETAVRDGGVILVEAECAKGVGIDHFLELLREASTFDAAMQRMRSRGYRLGDHKAVRLRALMDLRKVQVGVVSSLLDPAPLAGLGIRVFPERAAAAEWAKRVLGGGNLQGVVVHDAGNLALKVV